MIEARGSADSGRGRPLVFVHVGAHKTGTSLIQNTLHANPHALRRAGLRYVHKYDLAELSGYRRLMQRVDKAGGDEISFDRAAGSLRRLVEETDETRMLLSHENLMGPSALTSIESAGRLYPEAGHLTRELRRLLEPYDLRVVVTIRNQPDFVESMYVHYIMMGKDRSFRQHRARIDESLMSWVPVLEDLEAAVGEGNLQVLPFERIYKDGAEGYVRTFLKTIGVDLEEGELQLAEEQNRSFSHKALQIAQRSYPVLSLKDRKHLSRYLRKYFSNADFERPVLYSDWQRNRILRMHADSNLRILDERTIGSSDKVRSRYEPEAISLWQDRRLVELRLRLWKTYRNLYNRVRRRLSRGR